MFFISSQSASHEGASRKRGLLSAPLQRDLPPVNADVITSRGRAKVLAQEILAQQLLIETEDHRRIMIPVAEVLTILNRPDPPKAQSHEGQIE